ncbi:MAG: metallophosphoesterase [Chitinophagaceae bacterium]|nr:metallophosphoesterase [Chitinophagaceae bacterium]
MKHFLPLFFLFSCNGILAQDSIRYRVILIGDAGEINAVQEKTIGSATGHILPGKTSVFYLGDNIYPAGIGLPGTPEEQRTQQILASQYKPMRSKGAPVYFIPGNHDWDRMGPYGLAKIKRQWEYLNEQGDSLVQLVPGNGCPGPIAIHLTDSLVVVAIDSEWWLFPFDKTNPDADCPCNSRDEVVAAIEQILYNNRHKVILLASHHPFQSYGIHGGSYTLKDHIFPLTNIKKNLYIPLPVIGSLYPFLRSTFTYPEDLKHALYKYMVKRVDGAFGNFPNLIHVSGHEHGLQFIKNRQVQIVSGSGAKYTNARKGSGSLFADATQGFVTVDILAGNQLSLAFYTQGKDSATPAFAYTLPYRQVSEESKGIPPITTDSVTVRIHPSYGNKSRIHKFFFGENYRREWTEPVTLPVLRLSEIAGGLQPLQEGGGMQSQSLRLADKSGKEYVIRSVEKTPDALLPPTLSETFARDWLDDVTSAQHPFSALAVPPVADAVHVPHANPVIGVIAPDRNLGVYEKKFAGMVMLLEEREPLGESDNTAKMTKNLRKDNDNSIAGKDFLNARMLDLFLGDWDRHGDQWRWFNRLANKDKKEYVGVPRDRDQVFHLTQGLFPKMASLEYVLPTLRNFDRFISREEWVLFKTGFVNAYPSMQIGKDEWNKAAVDFSKAVTDSVLEAALARLPQPAYNIRHNALMEKLKARRARLPVAMDEYYRFIQKVADITVSDKNELVKVTDRPDGGLNVTIHKISKNGKVEEELMNKTYDKTLSREIRIYLGNGNDSVVVDNNNSPVRLRIIGGKDVKSYTVLKAHKKIWLYDRYNSSRFTGDSSRMRRVISEDSANTSFSPVNLYNTLMPLVAIGVNADDGLILGAGFKYVKQEGFRKYPYASMHQFLAAHSFSTNAYRVRYTGEWIEALGTADVVMSAFIRAPNNTVNFFGRGNETVFDKSGDFVRYYRTRYGTYQFDPSLRWRKKSGTSVSIGPSLYYYVYDEEDNKGRFINNASEIGSYDSSSIAENKLHVGVVTQFVIDKRSSKILPQWGSYISTRLQAYKGVGAYAKDFAQIIQEVALYKSIGRRSGLVIAERLGGVVSIGKTAFYQSAFLGGQENLLGYRQFRFAGQHSFYNNLEMRLKLADIASYILPGQLGLSGFWDIGRVWENKERSGKWHNGVGGGVYFVPASVASFNFAMGYSREGWYPYFTMGFRF